MKIFPGVCPPLKKEEQQGVTPTQRLVQLKSVGAHSGCNTPVRQLAAQLIAARAQRVGNTEGCTGLVREGELWSLSLSCPRPREGEPWSLSLSCPRPREGEPWSLSLSCPRPREGEPWSLSLSCPCPREGEPWSLSLS